MQIKRHYCLTVAPDVPETPPHNLGVKVLEGCGIVEEDDFGPDPIVYQVLGLRVMVE